MSHSENNYLPQEPSIWALVLHWRGIDYTRRCLTSLKETQNRNFRILLVDNGSDDKDGEKLKNEYPEIDLLRLETNHGFAGGCNAGMHYCLEKSADLIWLLNNDTTVPAETLNKLVEIARENPKAAAIGACIVENEADGRSNTVQARGVIDFTRAKTFLKRDAHGRAVDCEWLSGSNLLLRADALKQAGLFDETYFLYFEDTELCHRLRLKGWQCILVPDAVIAHTGNASTTGKRRFWRDYYYTRNRFLFFSQYLPGIKKIPAFAFIFAHLIRHTIVLPFRGEKGRNQLRAELLGARDFFQNSFGRAKCLEWCEEN
ncbi:MAG: hypothetical protein C0469_01930 [Cyanobacteria bacterium DS2.3.42]|nr:hypothetical protein [Cyanobacteria bacterium DS2.3.42]